MYFPATHSAHAPPSGPVAPALHVQLSIAPAPSGDHEWAGHAAHVASELAASACEYVLAAHGVQVDVPRTDLNVPATHALQAWPARAYPLSHRQDVMVLLPALEFEFHGQRVQSVFESDPSAARYVFTGQTVQLWSPTAFLYVPGRQSSQTHTSYSQWPALQRQASIATLAGADDELLGHRTQSPGRVRATSSWNVFRPQSTHASLPTTALYLPRSHAMHSPPLGPVQPALHEQSAAAVLAAGALESAGHP